VKCMFGYSYALAEEKGISPPEIVVSSHGSEYRISLKPDRVREVIGSEIETIAVEDDGFNTFKVKFPADPARTQTKAILDLLFGSSLVNPMRRIVYDVWGVKAELGQSGKPSKLSQETSTLWYESKQFVSLCMDFVKARPQTQLKEFISLFRGFTSKKVIREILQELNADNHDSGHNDPVQFFPTTGLLELSQRTVENLHLILRRRSKPISKRSVAQVLGVVGQEWFTKLKDQLGWVGMKYTCEQGVKEDVRGNISYPFLVELVIFNRQEDGEGLKIIQCVNFMASMEDIFSRLFDVRYRLGRVGITPEMPVTVLVHLICPVLKWLNYGKSGLDE
jgi:hypothetical protein